MNKQQLVSMTQAIASSIALDHGSAMHSLEFPFERSTVNSIYSVLIDLFLFSSFIFFFFLLTLIWFILSNFMNFLDTFGARI